MKQLTMKELSFIEDEIRAEEILGKTINWCASQCDDQMLKNELEQIAEQHQLNVAALSQYFNQSKMIQ
ncbi:hypothetical protein CJ195_03790 [Bacillus sp. UMB0899]|uniref:hypothetical protein n=1 Tax=Metabacillus schmidteae TaxID=2730405 RepID=UPI000C7FAA03|nr:hypothetical protein [Metabacillus schmidteae]PMC39072.1 hypothetical protein CJ195_03790 [Bacillus sp. UMB0899]